jgi:membrane-associated phospholipid phosphatase
MSQQSSAPHPRSISERPRPNFDKEVIALRLIGGAIVLWGLLSLIGVLVKHVLAFGRVGRWDKSIELWFVAHRTVSFNTYTSFANDLANTRTVIAIAFVLLLLLRWRLRRWYESWIIITVMVGEVIIFLAVTLTVHRHRPPVVQLDKSPPTSSFPSGHTAASMALYGAMAILLLWIYGRSWKTIILAVLFFCIPVVVALSRLYRGMHYPTDVLAGAFGGGLWLLIVISTLLPKDEKMQRLTGRSGAMR